MTLDADAPLPRGEQCPATSKRTTQRCRRLVIGGGPCYLHGGRARQVAAKREARIVAWQASVSATPVQERHPVAALVSAARDADEIVQRLRLGMAGGVPDMATLDAFGAWLDRVSRLAKAVIDAKADRHAVSIAEKQGELIAAAIRNILDAFHGRLLAALDDQAVARVRSAWPGWVSDIVPRELMRIAEQEAGRDG